MTEATGLSQAEGELLDQQDRWAPSDLVFGAMMIIALIIGCSALAFVIATTPWVAPT